MKKEEETMLELKKIERMLLSERITNWEKEFLKSISKQMLHKELSEKQKRVLKKIETKR